VSLEGLLGVFCLGDVARDAEGADDPAIVSTQGLFGGEDPAHTAFAGGAALLLADEAHAGADDVLFVGEFLAGEVLFEEVEVGFADRLVGAAETEGGGQGTADGEEAAFEVLIVNVVREAFEQTFEKEQGRTRSGGVVARSGRVVGGGRDVGRSRGHVGRC